MCAKEKNKLNQGTQTDKGGAILYSQRVSPGGGVETGMKHGNKPVGYLGGWAGRARAETGGCLVGLRKTKESQRGWEGVSHGKRVEEEIRDWSGRDLG